MGGDHLTYAELERRSNCVANVLRSRGVQRGDRVALYAHKSIDLLAALHGVLRAGAAYVPINPDAPVSYVRQIIDDCEVRHLITGPTRRSEALTLGKDAGIEFLMGLPHEAQTPVETMSWGEAWSASGAPPSVELDGDDLAYIIFTSGSTGRPKGIVHSHHSALAYARVASAAFGFRPGDRITNHAPLNFDLSTLELFGGLLAGAAVVIVPEANARLPASFAQTIEDEQVTVVNAVPFALVQLLYRGALDARNLDAVRWILFGGEVFPTGDLRALMQRLPTARFGNVYGPAEVNGCTYHIVSELPEGSDEPIPIGRLYEGMEAMLVDERDRPVNEGEIGELLIRSEAHMVGYWRQPEMTARSRLRRARGDGQEDVFYRTGDLVRIGEDELYRFVGRKDRQVKVRGHRIELDAIERALTAHRAVEQAAVYVVATAAGTNDIRAVVTLVDGRKTGPTTGSDLRRHLSQTLPRYAVPAEVEVADTLPRTLTGKADRVALTAAAKGRPDD